MYMCRPGCHGKYAAEFLAEFKGSLQTDEYAGYNLVPGITKVGCLAHARRKFTDALTAISENAKGRNTVAHEGVRRFDELFSLEKRRAHLRGNER
ncbi:Mobile element protein [Clostridiaceae bacterium JG1575]|nr:Mobile element protein [Clostridiaceae bacterium JG1575]